MAKLLSGKDVAKAILESCAARVSEMITNGQDIPKLSIVSIGDDGSNNSYLRGIQKNASETGIALDIHNLEEDISVQDIISYIDDLNKSDDVTGILLMRPLPKSLRTFERDICESISSAKDIDAANSISVAGSYLGIKTFSPCTAEACMKILEHYKIDVAGKNVVVLGRSLVVGKPVANMLLNENATVTICHSKSQNLEKIVKSADIVVIATGTAKMFNSKFFSSGQVVIDAGINWDSETSKLCGDVDFDDVEPVVASITPVPGGVGSVTSAVLISHLI